MPLRRSKAAPARNASACRVNTRHASTMPYSGDFFRKSFTSSAVGGRSMSSTRRKTTISNGSGEAADFAEAPASCPALPPSTGDCAGTRITPTGAATTSSHTSPRHHQRRQEKDITTTSPWKSIQDAASLQDFFFASTVHTGSHVTAWRKAA
jgi:hypothetical protein